MNLKAETFSINRFWLLIKRDLLSSYRAMLVRVAAATGILLLVDMLQLWNDGPTLLHHVEVFTAVLFVGGFIFTSAAFKEVHRRGANEVYLLIPASPLEKVGSRIVFFSIGWVAFVAVWYTLYILLSYGIGELLLGSHYPLHGPFHHRLMTVYGHYIILQSIFLVGAIFFRKTHFFKTILVLFLGMVGFALVMAFFIRIVFASYFTGFFVPVETAWEPFQGIAQYQFSGLLNFMERTATVFYFWIMAPAAWVFTYIRFREVQVKDGI